MTAAYGGWQWGKGSYSAPLDLVGHLAPAMTFSATFANPNPLRGDMPVMVTIPAAAAPTLLMNLTGDLAPQIAFSGLLGTTIVLGGDLPLGVSMAASGDSFGPLWAPDQPCAPVDWEESELCNG